MREHIDVDVDPGHFLMSKRDLFWQKMGAVLLWAFILVGCALGWNYGGPAIANWQEQRSERLVAEQEYKDSHYQVRWRCDNCNYHSSSVTESGGPSLSIVKGRLVGEALLDMMCPKCAVIGRLSPR